MIRIEAMIPVCSTPGTIVIPPEAVIDFRVELILARKKRLLQRPFFWCNKFRE
jgi:hypothetical protein